MMSLFCLLVAMALPFTKPAFQVTVEKDVPYATAPGYYTHAPIGDKGATFKLMFHSGIPKPVTLEMDIYEPVGDDISAKRPLLLMMHGGSFFIGNKSEPGQRGWGQYFASLGYVAVSIDYRLGFHALKKEIRQAEYRALEDADAALAYLLAREDLRIDPERVFLCGTSAGAMTALNLAFRLYGDKPMKEVKPRLPAGFRIRGVANLWGSVHDLSVLENARVPIPSDGPENCFRTRCTGRTPSMKKPWNWACGRSITPARNPGTGSIWTKRWSIRRVFTKSAMQWRFFSQEKWNNFVYLLIE